MKSISQPNRLALRATAALMTIALAACGNEAAEKAAADAAAARTEAAASEMKTHLDAAIASGRPDLARAFGEDLLNKYPTTAAGRAVAPHMPELRVAADAEIEAKRLRELWTYHDVADTESDGRVRTAFIYAASKTVGAPSVRLVLRRHASWGQSAYLLINDGDFACQGTCPLHASIDGGEERALEVSRAKDNVPPAVFIDDDTDLLAKLGSAKTLELRIKLAPSRETTLLFEVAGFDLDRLGPETKGSLPTDGKRKPQ